MLGSKKLSEIKKELRELLKKTDDDFHSWLHREISEHGQRAQDSKVLEDLLWVQKILRESVSGKTHKKPRRVNKKAPVGK